MLITGERSLTLMMSAMGIFRQSTNQLICLTLQPLQELVRYVRSSQGSFGGGTKCLKDSLV
jgi:hypothetical protein